VIVEGLFKSEMMYHALGHIGMDIFICLYKIIKLGVKSLDEGIKVVHALICFLYLANENKSFVYSIFTQDRNSGGLV
jgi:hypothetical protein